MGMKIHPDLERKILAQANGAPPPKQPPPEPARRMAVEVTLGLKLVSEANTRDRRQARMRRQSAVKAAVNAGLPKLAEAFPLPAVVTLTRLSTAEMDGDNLQHCAKQVRDQVARWLGVDDRDPRVKWKYRQRPGWKAGLVIRVEHGGRS